MNSEGEPCIKRVVSTQACMLENKGGGAGGGATGGP